MKTFNWKLLSLILFTAIFLAFTFLIPPSTPLFILAYIITISVIFTLLTSLFTKKTKYWHLTFVSVFLFLLLNYFVGFNEINTVLFISFVLMIVYLIK